MSPRLVPYEQALTALDGFLGWAGGFMPVWETADRVQQSWYRCGRPQELVRRVRAADELSSAELCVGLPQQDRSGDGVRHSTVLWVRVADGKQEKRAARFRPLPSLVIREGASKRRLLLWALSERLSWFDAVDMNKRIAYRLGAVQKWSDPDLLRISCPGSFLRVGRKRPVPLLATRLSLETFTAAQVAGRLKDPPVISWESGQMLINGRPVAAR